VTSRALPLEELLGELVDGEAVGLLVAGIALRARSGPSTSTRALKSSAAWGLAKVSEVCLLPCL
jgi:hypothetical protein